MTTVGDGGGDCKNPIFLGGLKENFFFFGFQQNSIISSYQKKKKNFLLSEIFMVFFIQFDLINYKFDGHIIIMITTNSSCSCYQIRMMKKMTCGDHGSYIIGYIHRSKATVVGYTHTKLASYLQEKKRHKFKVKDK